MTNLEKELLKTLEDMVTLYDEEIYYVYHRYTGNELEKILEDADFARNLIQRVKEGEQII